jgi:hypothetical protein
MRGLTAAEIVDVWERAAPLAPLDRGLAMLATAGEPDPAALPLALRDQRLLELRGATFGDRLDCVADCPDCAAAHDFSLSAGTVAPALVPPAAGTIEAGGRSLAVRALDSRDVAEAPPAPDAAAAFLTARACPEAAGLADADAAEAAAAVAAREEAGELTLSLGCAVCGRGWSLVLDVPAHLWAEVEAAALRLMGEVAEIARAFGWSEAAIMELSSHRRHAYLGLARGG